MDSTENSTASHLSMGNFTLTIGLGVNSTMATRNLQNTTERLFVRFFKNYGYVIKRKRDCFLIKNLSKHIQMNQALSENRDVF